MSVVQMQSASDQYFFDASTATACTEEMTHAYSTAAPFSHIVLDDFVPREFLEQVVHHFPEPEECSVSRVTPQQFFKRGYRPDDLGTNPCRQYLTLFNSQPFLLFLEQLTGWEGLIPDPYFLGGGMHEIGYGGRLAIHADFNIHQKLNLVRRINLLLYLNQNWEPEYGGNLELWNTDLTECVESIEPVFNRCVIFNTDKDSFHGHPQPLKCPPDRTRRSIALFYYTAANSITTNNEFNAETDWKTITRKPKVGAGS